MEYLKDEKHDLTVPNDMNPDPLGFLLGRFATLFSLFQCSC